MPIRKTPITRYGRVRKIPTKPPQTVQPITAVSGGSGITASNGSRKRPFMACG
jgi:hypothetical protein